MPIRVTTCNDFVHSRQVSDVLDDACERFPKDMSVVKLRIDSMSSRLSGGWLSRKLSCVINKLTKVREIVAIVLAFLRAWSYHYRKAQTSWLTR